MNEIKAKTTTPQDGEAKTSWDAKAFREKLHAETYPALSAEQVLKRALDKAHDRAMDLLSALEVLETLGGEDDAVISRGTLDWLAARFKADVADIGEDVDYALGALRGTVYGNANVRFVTSPEAQP